MARPPVDKRLQHIETSLDEIKNKLCEMSPCKPDNIESDSTQEAETLEDVED